MAATARTPGPDADREVAAPAPPATADPGPLGLACFALTTFVLSVFNARLMSPTKGEAIVLGLALFYGGAVQVLAGMWEFKAGNTFGATAFCSYGAFWMSLWAYVALYAAKVPESYRGKAVGLFLVAWGIFTAYMFVASFRTTAALVVVFGLLTITFFLLGIGNADGNTSIIKLGGWFGLATAIGAWYASFAGIVNNTFGRVTLPLVPLKR